MELAFVKGAEAFKIRCFTDETGCRLWWTQGSLAQHFYQVLNCLREGESAEASVSF